VREALAAAGPVLLEPVARVTVTVPIEAQGDVMGDLTARRGRIEGVEAGDAGEQVITATVPEAEMRRYAVELRSLTGGRGRFTARHERDEPVPDHLVARSRRELADTEA
jgi:elongation factor G